VTAGEVHVATAAADATDSVDDFAISALSRTLAAALEGSKPYGKWYVYIYGDEAKNFVKLQNTWMKDTELSAPVFSRYEEIKLLPSRLSKQVAAN